MLCVLQLSLPTVEVFLCLPVGRQGENMKKIEITLSESNNISYPIIIGSNFLPALKSHFPFTDYSQAFVLCDKHVAPLLLKAVLTAIPIKKTSYILPAGEKVKDITTVGKIWGALQAARCDRSSLVINLGGGVISDMGGFAASTYMRGIDFINIPTTLLSQVDASVGGKTGIDFGGIKNLVGTFNQPKAVIIDVATLQTLPKREFIGGFAEIVKHGFIRDKDYFNQVTAKHPLEFNSSEMVDIIAGSCAIKAAAIQRDPTEKGLRKILNFGHTIGHAIEALSLETETPLLHGEAVSIGMVAEAKLSQLMGFLSAKEVATITNSLRTMWLPITIKEIEVASIVDKMLSDKKNEKGSINFVLLDKIGKARYNQEVSQSILTEALLAVME